MNLMITLLGLLLAGTGGLLYRVDVLGDTVHGAVVGLDHHLREYSQFETRIGSDTNRLWEDVRDIRTELLNRGKSSGNPDFRNRGEPTR